MTRVYVLIVAWFWICCFNSSQAGTNDSQGVYASTNLVVLKPWSESKSPSNLPAFISAAVAVFLSYVGFQQYRLANAVAKQQRWLGEQQQALASQQHTLAQEKFKLDLFEKRYAVYVATGEFLSEIIRQGRSNIEGAVEFSRKTSNAAFLFEQPVVDYLDSLYKRAINLCALHDKFEFLPVGDERSKAVNEHVDRLLELGDEIKNLKDVFGPYLKFKHWS